MVNVPTVSFNSGSVPVPPERPTRSRGSLDSLSYLEGDRGFEPIFLQRQSLRTTGSSARARRLKASVAYFCMASDTHILKKPVSLAKTILPAQRRCAGSCSTLPSPYQRTSSLSPSRSDTRGAVRARERGRRRRLPTQQGAIVAGGETAMRSASFRDATRYLQQSYQFRLSNIFIARVGRTRSVMLRYPRFEARWG